MNGRNTLEPPAVEKRKGLVNVYEAGLCIPRLPKLKLPAKASIMLYKLQPLSKPFWRILLQIINTLLFILSH
jgi:hypothetical protein